MADECSAEEGGEGEGQLLHAVQTEVWQGACGGHGRRRGHSAAQHVRSHSSLPKQKPKATLNLPPKGKLRLTSDHY